MKALWENGVQRAEGDLWPLSIEAFFGWYFSIIMQYHCGSTLRHCDSRGNIWLEEDIERKPLAVTRN